MQEHTSIIQTRTNTTKSQRTNTNTNWMQKKNHIKNQLKWAPTKIDNIFGHVWNLYTCRNAAICFFLLEMPPFHFCRKCFLDCTSRCLCSNLSPMGFEKIISPMVFPSNCATEHKESKIDKKHRPSIDWWLSLRKKKWWFRWSKPLTPMFQDTGCISRWSIKFYLFLH